MGFTFSKNERGFSPITFPFMRKTIIPTTNWLFSPRITNPQNMPSTGPCFIYGNHSNYFDPFLLNVEMWQEPTAGVMTRDQFHKTLPRIFMDSIGIVPTSKYVPDPGIIRDVIRMINQERMIVIFPEGGRRWDGRPKPVLGATLKLFWKMNIPVHPVRIHGSYLGWPRWAKKPRKSSIEVEWLRPLHSGDFRDFDSFEKVCRAAMDFEEYDPPEESVPFHSWSPASGIERLLYRCPETGENAAVYTAGGKRVLSRAAGFEYTMNRASRLIDHHGEPHSIISMYDRINRMDMVMNRKNCLLEETGNRFYTVDREHKLIRLDEGTVRLTSSGLQYAYGSERGFIPLPKIRYISIDSNQKLSVTDHDRTLQFTIKKYSSLHWQQYLRRLQNGETPVRKL